MVFSSEERIDVQCSVTAAQPAESNTKSSRRLQLLCIVAVACVTLVAAPLLVATSNDGQQSITLQQVADKASAKKARFDELSSNLLGGLEKAMDSSVDTRVKALMKSPAKEQQLMQESSVPVHAMTGYHRLLPFDPHPYVTETQLDRLLAEKRELTRKREAILRTLRMRRQAAAAKAAKDATELDKIRLERAVIAAKKRELQAAEQASRAAAAKMREAAVAKQQALQAAKVAEERQRQLSVMSKMSHERAEEAAKQDEETDAAADMQYQQDKSVVDARLQGYLQQERDLLHKIAAVEKVAQHGGYWPKEGMPLEEPKPQYQWVDLAQKMPEQQQLTQRGASTGIESNMLKTLIKTFNENDARIKSDEAASIQLQDSEQQKLKEVHDLMASNRRLKKEMHSVEGGN